MNSFSDDMKFAWSLIRSSDWREGEEDRIKTCSGKALKMVFGRIKSKPDLYMDSLEQCGWKFEEEFKRREIDGKKKL
jgi:hypothetical protein